MFLGSLSVTRLVILGSLSDRYKYGGYNQYKNW